MRLRRALFACLGTLALSLAWVFGPLAFAHFSADTEARVLALSFDDGPYPPYTDALLDVLDAEERVRATFFLIEARLLAAAKPGAILVVHDGFDGGPGADRSGSVEAVRRVIPKLRAQGFAFLTLPELLDGAR